MADEERHARGHRGGGLQLREVASLLDKMYGDNEHRRQIYHEKPGEKETEVLGCARAIVELLNPKNYLEFELRVSHDWQSDSHLAEEDQDGGTSGPDKSFIQIDVIRSEDDVDAKRRSMFVGTRVRSNELSPENEAEDNEEAMIAKFMTTYPDLFEASGKVKVDSVEVRRKLLKMVLKRYEDSRAVSDSLSPSDHLSEVVGFMNDVVKTGADSLIDEYVVNRERMADLAIKVQQMCGDLMRILDEKYGGIEDVGKISYPIAECLRQIKQIKSAELEYRLVSTYSNLDRYMAGWDTDEGSEVIKQALAFIKSQENLDKESFVNVDVSPSFGNKDTTDYVFVSSHGELLVPKVTARQGTEIKMSQVRGYKGVTYHFDSLPRDSLVLEVGVHHWSNKDDVADCSIAVNVLNLPMGKMTKPQWETLKSRVLEIINMTVSNGRNEKLNKAFGSEVNVTTVANILTNKTREWMNGPERPEGGEEKLDRYGCAGIKLSAVEGAELIELSFYNVGQYMNNPTVESVRKSDL